FGRESPTVMQNRARATTARGREQVAAVAHERTRAHVLLLLTLVVATVFPALAQAQLLVHPRRPGQTNVSYANFDWRYVDLLTHEPLKVDIEWQRGPRFHLSPYRPPAMGTPWAWPSLRTAALAPPSTRDAGTSGAPRHGPRTSAQVLATAG